MRGSTHCSGTAPRAPGRPPREGPHPGSLCLRNSSASTTGQRSPCSLRPSAPRDPAPKLDKENGPRSEFHQPLVSPHYAPTLRTMRRAQSCTHRPHRRTHCPEAILGGSPCNPNPSSPCSAELAPVPAKCKGDTSHHGKNRHILEGGLPCPPPAGKASREPSAEVCGRGGRWGAPASPLHPLSAIPVVISTRPSRMPALHPLPTIPLLLGVAWPPPDTRSIP